jgi:hypothetical protein
MNISSSGNVFAEPIKFSDSIQVEWQKGGRFYSSSQLQEENISQSPLFADEKLEENSTPLKNVFLDSVEKINRARLVLFNEIVSKEVTHSSSSSLTLSLLTSEEDTFFAVIAEVVVVSENDVLKKFNEYLRMNPQKTRKIIDELAKQFGMSSFGEMTSKECEKLLTSTKSQDELNDFYSRKLNENYAELMVVNWLKFTQLIRCKIASDLFQLDIEMHHISINGDDIFSTVGCDELIFRSFSEIRDHVKSIKLAQGAAYHMGFSSQPTWGGLSFKSGYAVKAQFVQPILAGINQDVSPKKLIVASEE